MGVDKADLRLGDVRLADRATRVLTEVCNPVLEVGPGRSTLTAVAEEQPGAGPLVALVAGARALRRQHHAGPVILLAVDLPFVEPPLLRLLDGRPPAPVTAPVAGNEPQPCCARFTPDALALAEQLVADGARSLRALLAATTVDLVPEAVWRAVAPAHALDDLDTPDDGARHGLARPG